jgi:hypothetical protein
MKIHTDVEDNKIIKSYMHVGNEKAVIILKILDASSEIWGEIIKNILNDLKTFLSEKNKNSFIVELNLISGNVDLIIKDNNSKVVFGIEKWKGWYGVQGNVLKTKLDNDITVGFCNENYVWWIWENQPDYKQLNDTNFLINYLTDNNFKQDFLNYVSERLLKIQSAIKSEEEIKIVEGVRG